MTLVSSKVAAGIEILADQFNKLWEDLTTNHDHSSGKGGTVDHADLGETGPMAGRTYDHEDIDAHIDADSGIHGIPDGSKIGGTVPQCVIVVGALASPPTSGYIYLSDDGLSPADIILDTVISIALTCHGPTGDSTHHRDIPEVVGSYDAVNGRFQYEIDSPGSQNPTKLYFMVAGTKT